MNKIIDNLIGPIIGFIADIACVLLLDATPTEGFIVFLLVILMSRITDIVYDIRKIYNILCAVDITIQKVKDQDGLTKVVMIIERKSNNVN